MTRAMLAFLALASAGAAAAKTPGDDAYCAALATALDGTASSGPAFLRSYQPGPEDKDLPGPLRLSAFSYDNALAATAFVACGDIPRARRIADAFLQAIEHDRTHDPVHLRNAYRSGPVEGGEAKLPGWWDAEKSQWLEDAYQDGTATGNAAWVALALLNVNQVTHDARYLATARRLLEWIDDVPRRAALRGGYAGGVSGYDGQQETLHWESTEHNVDVAAAASWAHRLTGDVRLEDMANRASAFVAARFEPALSRFAIGTKADGTNADANQVALDSQVWPILGVPSAPREWGKAVEYAYANLRSGDGMTFTTGGENQWTEGSAQTSLSLHALRNDEGSRGLLASVARNAAPPGLVYATDKGEARTGLNVESKAGGEFKYYHRPHVGATAWAAIATEHWNPFTGERIP